ncbi:heparan sulfate glucosamine 3-O-sulfotransferase 5-like [Saccoglossus kowalevskii]|uniref:Heparan sulfate glucosamine 3-O-sulfotransferase 3A1-like n=1 Tax=Saccoglossus kowalevskii TaxID=10224 RepID=A0ABM0MYU9_SACKO|nr:PREDICTED: heparan sulfate glucosamine 3-O-sulfotransferase 3A1-like [Saccoglossus kowalevskii]
MAMERLRKSLLVIACLTTVLFIWRGQIAGNPENCICTEMVAVESPSVLTKSSLNEQIGDSSDTYLLEKSVMATDILENVGDIWDASVDKEAYLRAKYDNFCYKPEEPYFKHVQPLERSKLKQRGCRKKLPQIIMPGARKCGTGALLRFLKIHPNITGAPEEPHFFDQRRANLTTSDYSEKMPYSTDSQLVIEKTPTYFYRPHNTPQLIKDEISSDTKIIIVLCDPVRRAVSDYLEFIWREKRRSEKHVVGKKLDSFEHLVWDHATIRGGINQLNEMIDVGIYAKHLIRWFDVFSRDQILLLDGTLLLTDPLSELKTVERFLGLRSFFQKDHFSMNEERGIFCMDFPSEYCLPGCKGRKHPHVDDKVWASLCDFYAPYDRSLEQMTGKHFSWVGKCASQDQ